MRTGRTLAVLVLVAMLPLVAPSAWLHSGGFPNIALLVVTYLALEAGPAPAAWCGAIIGFLMCPWTMEPLGQHAFLLGTAGFVTGTVRLSFNRDLALVQLTLVAAAAFFVRLAAELLAGGAESAFAAFPSVLLSAGVTAVVAPAVFGLLEWARLLERRKRRRALV